MTSQQLSVKVAINSWRLVLERTDKIFSNLTEDQLLKEVAPGKNRLIYLWGISTAVNNRLFRFLGLDPHLPPDLKTFFISTPVKKFQPPLPVDSKKIWNK